MRLWHKRQQKFRGVRSLDGGARKDVDVLGRARGGERVRIELFVGGGGVYIIIMEDLDSWFIIVNLSNMDINNENLQMLDGTLPCRCLLLSLPFEQVITARGHVRDTSDDVGGARWGKSLSTEQ